MLSGHSFNALLKTLEEPPEHVKFLLATTDPHKIPVTVLSRCLQFNLKRLTPAQISAQLEFILQQEQLSYDLQALKLLARAADGSMRDALSLLDQAIIYGNASVGYQEVVAMLGTVAVQPVQDILQALVAQDAGKLLQVVAELADLAPDFSGILQQILQILHRIAVYQVNAILLEAELDQEAIETLARQMLPEDVQLFYQIALLGQRDLDLAPDPRSGFEMVMLRMLAFKPVTAPTEAVPQPAVAISVKPTPESTAPTSLASVGASTPSQQPSVPVAAAPSLVYAKGMDWPNMIQAMKIEGMTRQLANNCILEQLDDLACHLVVDSGHQHLCGGVPEARLQQALQKFTGKNVKLQIKVAQDTLVTPAVAINKAREDRQQAAVDAINNDDNVRTLKDQLGARILPGSIEPL